MEITKDEIELIIANEMRTYRSIQLNTPASNTLKQRELEGRIDACRVLGKMIISKMHSNGYCEGEYKLKGGRV